VSVGGEPIFSKKETGRFPNPGEVVGLLRQKLPASS
jgi:Rdx family protein